MIDEGIACNVNETGDHHQKCSGTASSVSYVDRPVDGRRDRSGAAASPRGDVRQPAAGRRRSARFIRRTLPQRSRNNSFKAPCPLAVVFKFFNELCGVFRESNGMILKMHDKALY